MDKEEKAEQDKTTDEMAEVNVKPTLSPDSAKDNFATCTAL